METKNYKSFVELISEIDNRHEQRDRGTLFELLVIAYLKKEPQFYRLFDEVWKLNEVPEEYSIPKKDTGVDLVARKRNSGELVAIQCKFYSEDTTIRKQHIDSFLNEVGKKYYAEGIIISSTDKWSNNAEEALNHRSKKITRIGLTNLQDSKIDWSSYSFNKPEEVTLHSKKTPRIHQEPAIKAVIDGFKKADRGKLIMAPGTGKTYTSLAIAEEMAKKKKGVFRVLYLVPSIQLLSQTLREWTADTKFTMDSIAVCSDRKVTKENRDNELEDITAADLGYPATTNYNKLLEYQHSIESNDSPGDFLTVFSTYQSIDVIIEAQKNGFYEFDLVVCDEAHRTTGATELGREASAFTKVHSNDNIKARKRLYQTATPRVYGEDARKKADDMSVVIADMNDPEIYGEEFYRIGFADAIRQGILTDYRVMVLAVDEEVVARRFQQMLAQNAELEFDDVTKIIGCWNGLVKRRSNSDETLGDPMRRAIAFTGTIRESKLISNMFAKVVETYINEDGNNPNAYQVEVDHADGSMNALEKNKKISWLKSDVPDKTCRILSNARFLTEGVDVPDLDAVMFLKPRRSKIDIAQAVGRVMRKADGKDYGYVILPIGVPAGVDPNSVLDNNEKYRVVWDVLNALRSLDERFDATINKLELNKNKPDQLQIIGVGDAPNDGTFTETHGSEQIPFVFDEEWSEIEQAIYGKIVNKVGNVRYWEDWSKDVADIAQKHMMRIRVMLEDENSEAYQEFQKFVASLRHNINNAISDQQAIEMLAQHLITKPVFEALFDSYSFVNNNPVSRAMDSVLKVMDGQGLVKEQKGLEDFYESVRVRAEGIDNLKAKQDIIIQLYDKFFKVGFKETTERLGIVFTPVEVVDFIIRSVDEILKKHFDKSISDEGVHILDPFTGTGTFIVRLLQSGLISKEDLLRKYTQEIHANEIILLSYYIAAINIEETFHSIMGGDYKPFEGIVLTDTFETAEYKDSFMNELFDENNERLMRQQENPIFAIIGNPPYSIGQSSVNEGNKSTDYSTLINRIEETYAKYSTGKAKNTLYDNYIKAFRWSSDRIEEKGIIAFVTNGSFIDGQSADGLRKCWKEEFNYVYVFNLRGDARTQGDRRRKEGGNVFGEGTRAPIAITLLVRDGSDNHEIYYHDIGDYLSREEKLSILNDLSSVSRVAWSKITPDENNDWINHRDKEYQTFIPFINESDNKQGVFKEQYIGVSSARDVWTTGFSYEQVKSNVYKMIDNYNSEILRLRNILDKNERISKVNKAENFIKWTRGLNNNFSKGEVLEVSDQNMIRYLHRPFTKKWFFYDKSVVEYMTKYQYIHGQMDKVLYIQGQGTNKEFSSIVTDLIPNYQAISNGKGFPLYVGSDTFGNIANINESFMEVLNMSEEEVFYYIYAVLNHSEYLTKYKNDLLKAFPKTPILKNKEKFVEIGKALVTLHLNYEDVEPYSKVIIEAKEKPSYKVTKMKHPKKGITDTIIYNNDITIKNIPEKAYEYIVNGKSAIQWIMEQYQVKIDKKSGITDDPNEYSNDEKYIFNLLLRIINVSVQTVDLVNSLPPLELAK